MAVRSPKSSSAPGRRSAAAAPSETRSSILDAAERLVQVRGFNAFSYADVAGELGITKASLHYHFPSKAGLGEALIARYAERFAAALAEIDSQSTEALSKLVAYAGLYAEVLSEGRMCLCGMLAAEHETLTTPMRGAVIAFLDDNESWIAEVLEQARRDGSLRFAGSAREIARSILAGLEGAMLLARSYGDVERFRRGAERLIAGLAGASA